MTTPVDTLLAAVEWEEIPRGAASNALGLPVATHRGLLEFAGVKLRVFQLSDGRRIIDADDIAALLGEQTP